MTNFNVLFAFLKRFTKAIPLTQWQYTIRIFAVFCKHYYPGLKLYINSDNRKVNFTNHLGEKKANLFIKPFRNLNDLNKHQPDALAHLLWRTLIRNKNRTRYSNIIDLYNHIKLLDNGSFILRIFLFNKVGPHSIYHATNYPIILDHGKLVQFHQWASGYAFFTEIRFDIDIKQVTRFKTTCMIIKLIIEEFENSDLSKVILHRKTLITFIKLSGADVKPVVISPKVSEFLALLPAITPKDED